MHDVYEILPLPEESGWVLENDRYSIDWEDKKNKKPLVNQSYKKFLKMKKVGIEKK